MSEIRHQARVYYAAVAQKKHINSPPPFNASVGWLAAFKKRNEVKFAHYHGESALAGVTGSLVEVQQIDAELSDSDQALPANQEEEETCEFGKKYNIKNAVDRIVEAWRKINVATVLHAWKPLFANSEITTLMDTVEAKRSDPALGFSDVQVEDLQEIVGQHQQQPTNEDMLEDEEQEEQLPSQEDDVKPGEPTTRQLTELLTNIAHVCEQLEEYDTRPHPWNLMCSALEKVVEEYKALYVSRAQPVNALANITLGDDDGTTDDDIEVLGDLLVEELPQDFEGFDTEVRGGSREEAVTSPPCLRTHQPVPSSISLISS
ncbi:putative Tc5 transposase DNA-binding domain-containing protein 4, partial [Homarus americanus]